MTGLMASALLEGIAQAVLALPDVTVVEGTRVQAHERALPGGGHGPRGQALAAPGLPGAARRAAGAGLHPARPVMG